MTPARLRTPAGGAFGLARLEVAALIALSASVTLGFLLFPVYPNYDSMYSLLWGRELLDREPAQPVERRDGRGGRAFPGHRRRLAPDGCTAARAAPHRSSADAPV